MGCVDLGLNEYIGLKLEKHWNQSSHFPFKKVEDQRTAFWAILAVYHLYTLGAWLLSLKILSSRGVITRLIFCAGRGRSNPTVKALCQHGFTFYCRMDRKALTNFCPFRQFCSPHTPLCILSSTFYLTNGPLTTYGYCLVWWEQQECRDDVRVSM